MGNRSNANPIKPIESFRRWGFARTVDVDSLRANTKLNEDIFDKRGVLLLAAGSLVTERFIKRLRRHHVTSVTAKPAPSPQQTKRSPNPPESASTMSFDAMVEANPFQRVSIAPFRGESASRLDLNQLRCEVKAGLKMVDGTAHQYEGQVAKIARGEPSDLGRMASFVQRFAELVSKDKSLGPMVAQFQSDTYKHVSKQVIKTAVLSVAIAKHLNLQASWINDIGVAALIQDLGMMRVPESIRSAARRLTRDEMLQIKHHPIYSLDMLEKSTSISTLVKIIVYQAHERFDGSGYPRGCSGLSIHPLARLLAVADTYSAMTTAKPQRKAMSTYTAVKQVLIEAHRNRLDRSMVRSFLDCLSVFPIGSRVMLSDGTVARVLRSNGSLHTKPVVLRLNDDQTESDTELDLSQLDHLQITRHLEDPLDEPPRASA